MPLNVQTCRRNPNFSFSKYDLGKIGSIIFLLFNQACRGNESTTSAVHATIASDCAVQSIGGWPALSDYMVIHSLHISFQPFFVNHTFRLPVLQLKILFLFDQQLMGAFSFATSVKNCKIMVMRKALQM